MSSEPLYHCLTQEEWINVTTICTYAETKVLYYLLAENPMGDRTVDCRVRTLAERLKLNIGTVSRAIKSLEEKKLIGEVTIQHATFQVKPRVISQKAQEYLAKKAGAENNNYAHEVVAYTQHNTICTQQTPSTDNTTRSVDNIDIYIDHARVQTIKDFSKPLDQSGGGVEKFSQELNQQPEVNAVEVQLEATRDPEPPKQETKLNSEQQHSCSGQGFGGARKDLQQVLDTEGILEKANSLVDRMKAQGIQATPEVVAAIKECHLSQLLGALRHVENTRATIKDPSKIFALNARKMPIEHLGPSLPVRTAEELGYWDTSAEEAIGNMQRIKNLLKNYGRTS